MWVGGWVRACVRACVFVSVCVRVINLAFSPRHKGKPHAGFWGFTSISGGWMLLCTEPIIAKVIPPHNHAAYNKILM